MWRHTKVKVSEIEGAPMVPLCLKFGAITTIIYKVTAFWKKWHTSFFFDRPPSWKCQSNHTGFQTYPSPKWKMADPRNFSPIRAFFMAGKNGTVFFNNWPPSWICHSDRTGCWTWVSPHRKEAISSISAQFYHIPGRYERVCVGWHCAKVKGHAEFKNRKNLEWSPLFTISPNYTIPAPTVSVLMGTYTKKFLKRVRS